jgi:GlpG protein
VRQIGTLPNSTDLQVFGDFLLSQGVESRALQSADGWAIWILDEDQVEKARAALLTYEKDPDDPRYADASDVAEAARREKDRRDREYRKNVRDMKGRYDRLNFPGRPLTIVLMAICIGLHVAEMTVPGMRPWIRDRFEFFSSSVIGAPADNPAAGLEDIHSGQVWRLVTPIFLHGDLLHLGFNMWALWVLGTVVEYTRGTRTLAALTLLSAVASNVGQYLYVIMFYPVLIPWVGISGVVYAIFGYVWMKSRFEPEHGIRLHPSSVTTMIFWLLLGFTGFLPMANGAHVVGLVVGMLYGLARF